MRRLLFTVALFSLVAGAFVDFPPPLQVKALPDFAAFTASGAGAGEACPLPNWILQSEDITTTWTNNSDSAPRNTTRTANYALSPIGDMTADRLEIPATTAPAQYSHILQGITTGWLGGPATCSAWFKGTSGSGSIPMYLLTGFPNTKAVCSFTAADWTLCSVSATTAGAGGENWYIGPSGAVAEGSYPAIDVLLWGMQCNAGLTRAEYVRTTTAAMGFAPKGARGEAFVFTRAGVAYCTKTPSGGFATSGISPGDLVLMPNNQPRIEWDSLNGKRGPLVESLRRSYCLQTEAIDNVVWTKEAGAGITPVGVWVNDGGAPNGSQTAEAIHFGATSGIGYADIFQTWNAALSTDAVSCSAFVTGQRPMDGGVAQDGTTDICAYTGAAWTCGNCAFTGDGGYSRCSKSAAGATSVTRYCKLGNNSNQNGGVARVAADLLVWGVQGESYANTVDRYPTSYAPVTTVPLDRALESTPYFALPNGLSFGSLALTVTAPGGHSPSAALLTAHVASTDIWESYVLPGMQPYAFTYVASTLDQVVLTGNLLTANVPTRLSQYRTPTPELCMSMNNNAPVCNGVGVGATITTAGGTGRLYVGSYNAPGNETDSIITDICLDDLYLRCPSTVP